MARKYVFVDESGNLDFKKAQGASEYFVLVSVTTDDCSAGTRLLELRRDMAWEGLGLASEFHATDDLQEIRDRVFALITGNQIRVDATIVEKCKTQPHLRSSEPRFYKNVWYQHMKYVVPKVAKAGDELFVVAASLGTKKMRKAFHDAIKDVMQQVSPTTSYRVAFWTAASEPCLQIADYCAWAIQRKWERGDERSYALLKDKVRSEFEIFRHLGVRS
jgi:hypothetical protein